MLSLVWWRVFVGSSYLGIVAFLPTCVPAEGPPCVVSSMPYLGCLLLRLLSSYVSWLVSSRSLPPLGVLCQGGVYCYGVAMHRADGEQWSCAVSYKVFDASVEGLSLSRRS